MKNVPSVAPRVGACTHQQKFFGRSRPSEPTKAGGAPSSTKIATRIAAHGGSASESYIRSPRFHRRIAARPEPGGTAPRIVQAVPGDILVVRAPDAP